jgi:PDZ domain-containing protein
MSRRTVAGLLAFGLAAVLTVVAAVQKVPYITFTPGPTVDILAPYQDHPVITVSGHKVYKDDGQLRLVTVYQTQPEVQLDLFSVMGSWFSSDTALIPRGVVFKKSDTNKTVQQQSALEMASSQDYATAAALKAAGIAYKTIVAVGAVDPDGASAGILKPGDDLLAVDGVAATDPQKVVDAIRPLPDKSPVRIEISRKGVRRTVVVRTRATKVGLPDPSATQERCPTGAPVPETDKTVSLIGITPAPRYVFPFDVKINLGDNIGGPSAGMMFALSIYDLLTPGSLTGGNTIAGSGEIDADGIVGAIGGIGQKLVGAQRDGAKLFLVASENWSEAIHSGYDPSKMKLVRVHTITDALNAVNAWRANHDASLPGCTR